MLQSFRSLSIYGASAAIAAVLPLIVLPTLANALGPSGFGIFSTARFAMQLTAIFVGSFLGFGLSRVFYESSVETYFARINGANLTTLALATLALLTSIPLSGLYGSDLPVTSLVVLVILGAVGFVWRQNYHRILVMIPRPGLAAGFEVVTNVMVFGGFLVALGMGAGWLGLVAVQTLIFGVTAAMSVALILLVRGRDGFFTLDTVWSRGNITRSLPFLAVGLVTPLLLTADKFILAHTLGLDQMGVYAATSIYLSGVFLLAGVFQKVYLPGLYKLLSDFHETKDARTLRIAKQRLWRSQIAIIGVICALAVGCTGHAYFVLDARYAEAVRITPIVVLAGSSAFVQVTLIPFFDSFDRSRHLSFLAIVGIVLSSIGLYFGSTSAGLIGAAAGLAAGQILYCICALGLFARQTHA